MGNCLPPRHTIDKEDSTTSLGNKVLEQVVSQEGYRQHGLYKLANYQKSGALIDAYKRGGSREVKKFARQELLCFMYGEGKGAVLPYALYVQWGKGNKDEVSVAVDNLVTSASNLENSPSKEYRICWRLDSRGMLGESLLHILIICNTPLHTRIALILLKLFPYMAWDFIEGEEYFGAGALHLSIAYQNMDIFDVVINSGANIHKRATGRFFLPYDQQRQVPKKQTDFQGLCYMGEYALAWAACCENEAAYNKLLHHGADPNLQDSFGNMILHVIVVRDKLNMYGYTLRHPVRPCKENITNMYGLTPLTLACKLGRNEIFREMLELSALEFWRYSNITCSGYPLNALDSILPSGETNWNSALLIILNGKTTEHLDMLDGGVIQRLLEEKWKTFARREFIKRLGITFLHLIVLSITVFLRPPPEKELIGEVDAHSICRYVAELGTCFAAFSFLVFQQGEEIKAQGLLGFLFSLSSNPAKGIYLFANILVILCVPCRIAGQRRVEDILLTIAIPCSWVFLIFFAGAVKLTGPFVTMIYNMLVGDIVRFCIIYVVFLLAFTQAFYFLFKGHSGKTKKFETYPRTWMTLFHMTLGFYEYREFKTTFYSTLTWLVFAVFMVIMPILLLNMLIAMMGNTYCEVITQSQKEWVKQWAKIVVALERGISQKKAKEFMQSYSIRFGASSGEDDSKNELRAVMVIKNKPKSKARQRKGAICNWKRMGQSIVKELRQPGFTAASLKQRFNSLRNSITKLPVSNQSDDSEGEIKKEDGFVSALNQLTFSHNLNLAVDTTSNNSGSPPEEANFSFDDSFNQLMWNQDSEVGKLQTAPKDKPRERAPTEFLEKKESVKMGIINEGFFPSAKNPRFLPAINEHQSSENKDRNLEDVRGLRSTKKAPISQDLETCVHHHKKCDKYKKKKHKKHFRNRAKVGIGTEHFGKVNSENKLENENLMDNFKANVLTQVKDESTINSLIRENGNALKKMNGSDSDVNWNKSFEVKNTNMNGLDSDDSWNKTVEGKRFCSYEKIRHKKRKAKSSLNTSRSIEQHEHHGTFWNSETNKQPHTPGQDHNK